MYYGDWQLLILDAGKDKNKIPVSKCQCKCGFVKLIQTTSLVNGKTKKCNSCRKKDSMKKLHIGKKFHMLTIIDQVLGKKSFCKCDCGNEKIFRTGAIISGQAKSCGCIDSIQRKNYDEHAKNKLLKSIEKKENGCWEWQKARHRQGYGHFAYKRKVCLAHRMSWILHNGPIDDSILVLHKCDNPPCCNPDHLFLGTDKDNFIDAVSKGRIKRCKGEQHYYSKLTENDVLKIRQMASEGMLHEVIASEFNISKKYVSSISTRRNWKHVK